MESDKRKSPRIKKTIAIMYLNPYTYKWMPGMVRDLSEGGINFTSDVDFPANSNILLKVKLPSNPLQWLECSSRLVESRALGFGLFMLRVAFIELDEDFRAKIAEYIHEIIAIKDHEQSHS